MILQGCANAGSAVTGQICRCRCIAAMGRVGGNRWLVFRRALLVENSCGGIVNIYNCELIQT